MLPFRWESKRIENSKHSVSGNNEVFVRAKYGGLLIAENVSRAGKNIRIPLGATRI